MSRLLHWEWEVRSQHHPLKHFLQEEKKMSRRTLTFIKRFGELRVNGKKTNVNTVITNGDLVTVGMPLTDHPEHFSENNQTIDILFEDKHLIVVNKQPGMSTLPTQGVRGRSLAEAIMHYARISEQYFGVHPVNRLDRFTSGIVVFAKHRYAHDFLTKSFHDKRYIAVVDGQFPVEEKKISLPIGRHRSSIVERQVTVTGKPAKTIVKRIEEHKRYTVLSVKLFTGRTHQIRVHLSAIGYPIVGDTLYGSISNQLNRQALHAANYVTVHPITQKPIQFYAPTPKDIVQLLSINL
ncbi:RluA family pseudouridine synthase [Geomicrobium sp. JCM 19038]|uniref:RluA family pseudouridine synthase n=1 Tax=Geomicrobium sp. JCM 19038 TaxID=1460635 RepID=UPI0005AB718C|nr:RluA family pseudouridine synthase [Geomicrobium sp. JCM 19038]